MSTPVVQVSTPVGGDVLLKGIRHFNNHESVLCVLHVEEGEQISTTEAENQTVKDKTQRKKKVSSGKSVHFTFLETESRDSDSYDRSSSTSSNSSLDEEVDSSNSKMSVAATTNFIKTSVASYGLSPRIQRKKKGPLKPSPLLTDSTEKIGENCPKTHKKSVEQSPATQRKSVDKLGLSPRIRRKGSAKAPSVDGLSSNQPLKKHSWPVMNTHKHSDLPPAPLHSNFVGSDEELEKLRFIKNALSPLPIPISPEQFRKRSSTFGEGSNRQVSSAAFRERSSTLEGVSKKEVYSKYNSLTMKVQEVNNSNNKRKPRYGSAH